MLPSEDRAYLEMRFPGFSETIENHMICIVLPDFQLPEGLQIQRADLLLRLAPGYPDIAPDMWWFDPPVVQRNGEPFPQTDVQERYLGRDWQRWSRHLNGGQWCPGVDSLETYIALIQRELVRN